MKQLFCKDIYFDDIRNQISETGTMTLISTAISIIYLMITPRDI